jgi:hypothetical protein
MFKMSSRKTWISALTFLIVICTVQFLIAQPHSDNYILKKWEISSGGGSMSSANYHAVSVVGQSSPPGVSSSTNYTLYSGFLQPIWALPGSALVWIWNVGTDVHLDWEDVPHANTYYIYRSLEPDVEIIPGNLLGSSSTSDYIDVDAVSVAGGKYFYRITCSN